MTQETRIVDLAQAIGGDYKTLVSLIGDAASLNTTEKKIVDAVNEVLAIAKEPKGAQIDDTATNGATTVVWSADKAYDELLSAINTLRNELTDGAGPALDTFKDLAEAMDNDPNFARKIAEGLNNRVRFDAEQTLTVAQKKQVGANIGMGDFDHDFVADYNTAKAGA